VTLLFTIFILIWGTISYDQIPRELTPQIEIPAASIMTVWPGASPGDVEKLITNKIEKEIKGIENLKKYSSASLSGVSVVSVEFEIESDMTENIQNLREKLDKVKPSLPSNIPDDPDLREISISDYPILSLTLSGDFAWSELKRFAESLESEFEGVSKVKDVSVKGAPKDEVHILVDPIAMQARKIGINEVFGAIRAAHRDMPLGMISVDGQKVEVTLKAELENASDFMQIPVKMVDGALIKLSEIASVRREFDKFEVETYYHTQKESRPAVSIDIVKSASRGNVLTMVSEVLGKVELLRQNKRIPRSLDVSVTYNRGDDIQESLDVLLNSGGQTLILIAILMFIALGWREAVLASVSIPLSLLIAITFLHTTGNTFNGIVLFALVLSIGLLVDNSIIIVEGISSGIHQKKLSPINAAINTLKTFRWPIITGTLTTIFAFLPMLFFITGVSGQYISVLPKTITTVLLGALFVSLFLLPAIGANFYKSIPPKKQRVGAKLKHAQGWYEIKMKSILASPKKTWGILLASFAAFIFSLSLVITNMVPVEVFPESDQRLFSAKIELPLGTKLEETRKLVDPISEAVRPYFHGNGHANMGDLKLTSAAPPSVSRFGLETSSSEIGGENAEDSGVAIATDMKILRSVVYTVGKQSDATRDPTRSSNLPAENILGITFNLTNKEDRETPSYALIPLIRESVERAVPAHAEVHINTVEEGPPSGSPIEVRLMGPDLSHLESMAETLKSEIEAMDGTLNVRDSRSERTLQYTWQFDRALLARFGLTPAQTLESLRAAVNGITVVKITEGGNEIDVDLRIDWKGQKKWDDPRSLDILNRIPLKTPSGQFIMFGQVATAQLSSELSEIEHRDGMRVILVRSDLESGVTASMLVKDLKTAMESLPRLSGEVVELGGENEEGRRLMTESGVAMGFSLILILVVLVWQFNSFYQSLVTLVIIPISLTGVFIGFWLTNMTITFPTMIGVVSLAGIIVNDAIVLIDRINKHVDENHWISAFIEAGKERMQPIFLTSVTTVVGMLPLSLSDEVWGGLGFAIVYGMTLSTVLTLLLIPCFLAIGKRWHERADSCCERILRFWRHFVSRD